MEENLRPESARSNRSNRVIYQPTQSVSSMESSPSNQLQLHDIETNGKAGVLLVLYISSTIFGPDIKKIYIQV